MDVSRVTYTDISTANIQAQLPLVKDLILVNDAATL